MFISRLTIRNFRNFRCSEFTFRRGINTLIGENGSGKSNVLYALRLLLDDSISTRNRYLTERDFNRSLKRWKGEWIVLSATFDDLGFTEESQILAHLAGHVDPAQTGSLNFYFRPKFFVRKRLYELSISDAETDELSRYVDSIKLDDYEATFSFRGTANFADDNVYSALVGDASLGKFPDPNDKCFDLLGVPAVDVGFFQRTISCTFIKALRDVHAELRSARNSPLIQLLRRASETLELADGAELIGRVRDLNLRIADIGEVKKLSIDLKRALDNTAGATYAPEVTIRSELPEDLESLLRSLAIWVGDEPESTYLGRLDELSLGAANLIFLALRLLEYELAQSDDRVAHFLLIEEPEAHIHTHVKKTLFDKYRTKETQVIISTHSTHISSTSRISSVNVLGRFWNEARVFQPAKGLSEDQIGRAERYLDAMRSEILFAKGIVLTEGDAEAVLVPALFRSLFGVSLDELGVSLIGVSSAVFTNLAVVFHEERIQRRCSIATDLDASPVPLPAKRAEDTKRQRQFRDSQKAGELRRRELESFEKSNAFVRSFYAKHTFEIDLLTAGNFNLFAAAVPKLFKTRARQAHVLERLASERVEIAGLEALRLADRHGKGWFALLLANYVSFQSQIPSYIVDAIAFAAPTPPKRTLRAMCIHRLEQAALAKDATFNRALELLTFTEISNDAFLKAFAEALPHDSLTRFVGRLAEFANKK